jgi:hypothetical protein
LDDEVRLSLEKSIDNFIKTPVESEKTASNILEAQGIEPNLETILSLIAGTALGITFAFYRKKFNRDINRDECIDLIQLIKRRAWELREAFIETRTTPTGNPRMS